MEYVDKLMQELNRYRKGKLNTSESVNPYLAGYYEGALNSMLYSLEVLGVRVKVDLSTLNYVVVK